MDISINKVSFKQTLERLEQIRDLKIGDPPPKWMVDETNGNWGEAISKLCGDAALVIRAMTP